MSQTPRRVAVTGLGAVSALGAGVAPLWRDVCSGRSGIRAIETIPTERLAVRTAAQVPGFDPAQHFEARRLPGLDRNVQLALVAAREAMAGIAVASLPGSRAGVIVAAAIGQETLDSSYQALYGEDARRLPPLTVPRIMPSGAASHISMEFGIRGPCFAVASACASSAHAIGLAFQMIRAGTLDLAVTGGADASLCPGFLKAWDALRILSPDLCRPFSRDRAGLVLGEGAGILVLEAWDEACRRDAAIYGEVVGFGMSADASDLLAPDDEGAATAMRAALADANLPPESVGYVNAHGTGTRRNDRSEVRALRRVFGDLLDGIAVSSSKSMLGHCLNAAGALEAIVTLLALREGRLPPTAHFREADPECAIDCVPNAMREACVEVALSNSFAFGGLNAVLVLQRAR